MTGQAPGRPWNIWQAIAWLRWESEPICELYAGPAGVERYRGDVMFPKMAKQVDGEHPAPQEKRSRIKVESALLAALGKGDLRALSPQGEFAPSFWLVREHLDPRRLPADLRIIDADLHKVFPRLNTAAAEWMVAKAATAMTTGRPLKAREARKACAQEVRVTFREAEAAWNALPPELKRSRKQPSASRK